MAIIRIIWRSLLLLFHLALGMTLNLIIPKQRLASGEKLADMNIVSWWQQRLCRILNLTISVEGEIPNNASMIVSNHISWLDIPVISSQIHTGFLSKHAVKKWPVIGWLATSAGTLFIKRGKGEVDQVKNEIAQRLQGDRMLTIFPEGTTSDGKSVRTFFPRLFSAAMDIKMPIVPVALQYHYAGKKDLVAPYIDDQTLVANLIGIMSRPSSEVTITFCPAIDYLGMDRKKVAENARQAIVDIITQ